MFSLVVNTITSTICSQCPVSTTTALRKLDTYTEDGTNGGGFDGGLDQSLDDRVGLWRKRSSNVKNPHYEMTKRGAHTAETGLASTQVDEQSRAKRGYEDGIRTGGSLSDDGECTNVMRTVRTAELVSCPDERGVTGGITDHR